MVDHSKSKKFAITEIKLAIIRYECNLTEALEWSKQQDKRTTNIFPVLSATFQPLMDFRKVSIYLISLHGSGQPKKQFFSHFPKSAMDFDGQFIYEPDSWNARPLAPVKA